MKRQTKYGNRRVKRKRIKNSRKGELIKPRHFTQRDRYSSLDNIVDGVSAKGKQPKVYTFPKLYAAPVKTKKSKEYLGSDLLFDNYAKKPKKEVPKDKPPKPKMEKPRPLEKVASPQEISDRIELIEKAA